MNPELKQQLIDALESAEGNINPERGFCDEVEAEIKEALAALRAEPDEDKFTRIGKYVTDFARRGGWTDDGEGAFEFIQRMSYTVGMDDGKKMVAPQSEPLTDEQIKAVAHGAADEMWPDVGSVGWTAEDVRYYRIFTRAVGAAHGIKPKD